MDLKPGQLLGSYRIEERLVGGGMAKVYRAPRPSTNREVAIKVLPAMARIDDVCARAPFTLGGKTAGELPLAAHGSGT